MTGTSCFLGIDPGVTGALAFFFPAVPNRVSVEDMPVSDKAVDPAALSRIVERYLPTFALVEHVHAMPKNGSLASFSLGRSYGVALAILAVWEIPTRIVSPREWKAPYRIAGGDVGKEKARAEALRLFPASAEHFARVKDHGRADAALLARFGWSSTMREAA